MPTSSPKAAPGPLPEHRLVTVPELADLLHVSTGTVYNLVNRGMPSFTVGRSRRFRLPEVEAWIATQNTGAAARLVDQAVEQGHPRHITDPSVIDRAAVLVQRGGDAA